jgi:hypothetical protein
LLPLVRIERFALLRPFEAILGQEFRSLDLRLVVGKPGPEAIKFQARRILKQRPQFVLGKGKAATDFIGHLLVIVPTLIHEKKPSHDQRNWGLAATKKPQDLGDCSGLASRPTLKGRMRLS